MSQSPNILLFMTDQQQYRTLEAGFCRTPHLQAMAREGVRFTYAFTPTPICTPARASAQTGLWPHQHRLVHNTHRNYHLLADLPSAMPTLGSMLTQAGYFTHYVGKWHVSRNHTPLDHGYQTFCIPQSLEAAQPPLLSGEIYDPRYVGNRRGLLAAVSDQSPEHTEPMLIATEVCRLIRQNSDRRQPFFIFASTNAPHVPCICPQPYARLYAEQRFDPWPSYGDDLLDKPQSYRIHYNRLNFCRLADDWPAVEELIRLYLGMVTLVDDAVGSILRTLEECGLARDTLVIFTSDHGELLGAHGLVGKDELLCEELVRVPLLMRWPAGLAAGECDAFVSLCDLFATCAEAASSETPIPPSSRSLLSPARGQTGDAFPDEIVLEHHGSMFFNTVRSLRTRRWKYVFRPHEIDELYDLEADPGECRNLAGDPACADTLNDLRRRLLERMELNGDMAAAGAACLFGDKT